MAGSNITRFFMDAFKDRGSKCMIRDINQDNHFLKESKIPPEELTLLCRAAKEKHGFLAKDLFKQL